MEKRITLKQIEKNTKPETAQFMSRYYGKGVTTLRLTEILVTPELDYEDRVLLAATYITDDKVWIEWACQLAELTVPKGTSKGHVATITELARRRHHLKATAKLLKNDPMTLKFAVETAHSCQAHKSASKAAEASGLSPDDRLKLLSDIIKDWE